MLIAGIIIGILLSDGPVIANDVNVNKKVKTVRIAAGEWSPYMSEYLKDYGIAARIISKAFQAEGIDAEFTFLPWKRAFILAKLGKWDGTALWLKKPEREAVFYYSDPVIEEKHVFFHRKDFLFDWNRPEDLKDIALGGLVNFSYGEDIDNAIKAGIITVERVTDDIQSFRMLLSGRIQVYPQEINVGYDVLRKHFASEERQLLTHHGTPFLKSFSYLLLSKKIKKNEQLIQVFNKGLKSLKKEGNFILQGIKNETK